MTYLAIGDNVTLASQLESSCKYYGTEILLTDSTYDKVHNLFLCRWIDRVKVKVRLVKCFF